MLCTAPWGALADHFEWAAVIQHALLHYIKCVKVHALTHRKKYIGPKWEL